MDGSVGKKLLQSIEKILETITMVGFIGMLLSTGGQVLFRYALRISVPWTEELARILFILTMFLGISIAIREREHIVVDFLFKRLNPRIQAVGLIIYNTAIFLLLCFLHGAIIVGPAANRNDSKPHGLLHLAWRPSAGK